jgi:hypothetical protein
MPGQQDNFSQYILTDPTCTSWASVMTDSDLYMDYYFTLGNVQETSGLKSSICWDITLCTLLNVN